MPEVIINFKIQETGVDEVLDGLTATNRIEQQMATSVKAANASFNEQTKAIGATVTASEKLAASFKGIPKVIIGGAAREVEDLRQKFSAGKLSVDAFATAVNLAKKQLDTLPQGSKAFNDLQNEIKASVVVNEQLNKSFTSTRSELRAMREALVTLEDAGLENTRTFQNLATQAGQLDDQLGDTQARIKALGSDTLALDAGIQVVQGVAGAYGILQGVTALVGNENEELQQTLLQVNAGMSILTGLQQVQQILQKQSIAVIVTENALRRIGALSINLQAAAESRYTVIRVVATQAQAALNAVMAANPATVLLAAIGLLAGALLLFANRTDKAAEAQKRLDENMKSASESAKNQAEIVDLLAQGYQTNIDLLRAQGATQSQIAAAEAESIRKQLEDQRLLQQSLAGRSAQDEEYSASVAKEAQLRGQLRVKEAELLTTTINESKEASDKFIEDNRKATEKFLQDQVAAGEAAVLQARTARERVDAEINLALARARQTIGSPDTSPNERLLAEVQAGEAIKKAREAYFGDLEKLDRDHNTRLTQFDNEQVLQNAQNAQQILEIKRQSAEEQLRITQDRVERERQLELQVQQAIISTAANLAGAAIEITRNQNDAQLAILQDRLDKGLISEREYDQQVRILKRRQAQQEKQLAIFQAVLHAAGAILQVFANTPPPASFVLAALTAALTAAQIAAIASQPLPAFAKGTKNAPGGNALVGEAGAELIYQNGRFDLAKKATVMNLQRGAKVIPAMETAQILNSFNIPLSGVPQDGVAHNLKIDYNKLGEAIGYQISKLPLQVNTWDERGFTAYQARQSNKRAYKQHKYGSH